MHLCVSGVFLAASMETSDSHEVITLQHFPILMYKVTVDPNHSLSYRNVDTIMSVCLFRVVSPSCT